MSSPVLALLVLAGSSTVSVHLEYEAPEECPTVERFWAELEGRLPRFVLKRGGEDSLSRTLTATLTRAGDKIRGVLVWSQDGQPQAERSIEAKECGEVVGALSVIAALFLDQPPKKEEDKAERDAKPSPRVVVPRADRLRPMVEPEGTFSVGADLVVHVGPLPDVALGPVVFFELKLPYSDWDPTLRLGLGATGLSEEAVGGGRVSFVLSTASLSFCPVNLQLFDGVTVSPCVRLDAGVLEARGESIPNPQSELRPFVAPGLSGRVRWRFWGGWFVETEARAGLPVFRDRFFFAPDRTVHHVSEWIGAAKIGTGLVFR